MSVQLGAAATIIEAPAPSNSYFICATPRTGSYLLCEGLRQTGIAGCPAEYFLGGYQSYWGSRWKTSTYGAYIQRVLQEGTTPNGVFGLKCHAHQFVGFIRQATGRADVAIEDHPAVVADWFPAMRYIWLRRNDRFRQAISYTKSMQTKVWWDSDKPPAPYDEPRPDALRFDFSLTEWSLAHLAAEDATWATYFRVNGIRPLEIFYEDLVENHDRAVRQVVEHIGQALPENYRFAPSRFKKQADHTTERWLGRYKRLADARRDRSVEGLRGLHEGDSLVVLDGAETGADLTVAREQVTIGIGATGHDRKVDYALVIGDDPRLGNVVLNADIVMTDQQPVDNGFVIGLPGSAAEMVARAANFGADPAGATRRIRLKAALELSRFFDAGRVGVLTDAPGPREVSDPGDALSPQYEDQRPKVWNLGAEASLPGFAQLLPADFCALPPLRRNRSLRRSLRVVVYSALDDPGWCAELARCIMAATEHHARFVFAGPFSRSPAGYDLGAPLVDAVAVEEMLVADVVMVDGGVVAPEDENLLTGKPVVTLRQPDHVLLDTRFIDAGMPAVVMSAGRPPRPGPAPQPEWSRAPIPLPWWESRFSPAPRQTRLVVTVAGSLMSRDGLPFADGIGEDIVVVHADVVSGPQQIEAIRSGHVLIDCGANSNRTPSLLGLAYGNVVLNNHGLGASEIAMLRAWAGGERSTPFVLAAPGRLETALQGIVRRGLSRLSDDGAANRRWVERHWSFEHQWDQFWWPVVAASLRHGPDSRPRPRERAMAGALNGRKG